MSGMPVAWLAAAAALLALAGLFIALLRRLGASSRALRSQKAQSTATHRRMLESRQRLQLLLDHMPDGVLAFDAQGRVEWINPAARLIFQCSVADAVGQPVAQLIPDIAELSAVPAAAVDSGSVAPMVPRQPTRGLRRDGSAFPLEAAVVALRSEGAPSGMCVCRDITDAQRVERMKSEFLSMVSHELRTPLTSLRGSLSLLTDGSVAGLPPDARRLLALANANSERLVMLVNDILDFEQLRAGALKIEPEAIDLGEIALKAVESLEGMARQTAVKQRVLSDEAEFPVWADPARLMQVLTNLLSNAIKYSPPGGTVSALLERRGERVRLTVRDRGPGVPAEFVARLFLPFEQARNPKHRKQGGTGLGLAISRGLMEMMHGAIGLEPSAPGEGASFWIELLLNRARPSTFGDLE